MRLWKLFTPAAVVVALVASNAQAARMFLTVGETADASSMATPVINVNDGEVSTVHVWLVPDPDQRIIGAAWSVTTDNLSALQYVAGSSVVDNPGTAPNNRWSNPTNAGTANVVRGAETMILDNTRGAVILGAGIGVGSLPGVHTPDSNGAFHMGRFQVRAAGNSGVAGLYLRVGQNLFNVQNGAGATITSTVNMFFGDDDTVGTPVAAAGRNQGDPLDIAQADARFQLGPIGPGREILEQTDQGSTPVVVALLRGTQPEAFPIGGRTGQLQVPNIAHSFFDVFFDLSVNDPAALQALAAQLMAEESNDGLAFVQVLPDGNNALNLPGDYDLHIQYTVPTGSNQVLDFAFPAGVTVNSVAIPEPSTFVLAGLGLVGLVVARRRRG